MQDQTGLLDMVSGKARLSGRAMLHSKECKQEVETKPEGLGVLSAIPNPFKHSTNGLKPFH